MEKEYPWIYKSYDIIRDADYVIIIGTSMQVYPAAGLVDVAPDYAQIWYIDKNPASVNKKIEVVLESTTIGVRRIINETCKLLL